MIDPQTYIPQALTKSCQNKSTQIVLFLRPAQYREELDELVVMNRVNVVEKEEEHGSSACLYGDR